MVLRDPYSFDASVAARAEGAPHRVVTSLGRFASRPWHRNAVLVAADAMALLWSASLALLCARLWLDGGGPAAYYLAGLSLLVAPLAYALSGAYAFAPRLPLEELPALSRATTLSLAGVTSLGVTLLEVGPETFTVLLIMLVLALLAVPSGRALVRVVFSARPWWGCAVIVLGAGRSGQRLVRELTAEPAWGFRPVAVLDDDPRTWGTLEGVPVPGGLGLAPDLCRAHGVHYAIVATPALDDQPLGHLLERHARCFERVIVLRDMAGLERAWTTTRPLAGFVAIDWHCRLMYPLNRSVKRALDVAQALLGLFLLALLAPPIALLIKLDSPGPVLYKQYRLGRDGRCFRMYKFRSMVTGAHARLEEAIEAALTEDPAAREEYECYRKLRQDPRVTRVGRVLRKYSLDELPQLLNVLQGTMSMTGPRPYLPSELPLLQGRERMLLRAKPGVTGFWQVMGRNDLSFETRIAMDLRYIHNWSFTYDLYLLARTIPVVLFGKSTA